MAKQEVRKLTGKKETERDSDAEQKTMPEAGVDEPDDGAGPPLSVSALVDKMIQKLESQLDSSKEIRATLGDFIRLLQLQKELDDEKPKEIRVTWIEPQEPEKESAPEI